MFPLIHGWIDVDRTTQANARLGATLSFVAGAANAGGFLAVGQYTSHMTGVVSSIADHLVLGNLSLALAGLSTLVAFVLGAMTTAWIVNWGLRHRLRSSYGLALLVEAVALLLFGPVRSCDQSVCRGVFTADRAAAVLHHGAAKRGDHQDFQG